MHISVQSNINNNGTETSLPSTRQRGLWHHILFSTGVNRKDMWSARGQCENTNMFLIARLMQDFVLLRPPHWLFHHTNHHMWGPSSLTHVCMFGWNPLVRIPLSGAGLCAVWALLSLTVDCHVGPAWSRKTKLNRQTAAMWSDSEGNRAVVVT